MQQQTVLFVIASLEYSGAARQLSLLAASLPRESFRVCVAVLGTETPWAASLRAEGVEVKVLGWRRPFDVLPFVALRRLVKSIRPDVFHVWGTTALRAVMLTGSRATRLLVSAALSFAHRMNRMNRVDRWLLTRSEGVIAFGMAEAERYRRLGVADTKVTVVSPAMLVNAVTTPSVPDPVPVPVPDPVAEGRIGNGNGNGIGKGQKAVPIKPIELPGVATNDRVLLGLGPLSPYKGFREAVWAFDIVRHLYDDVHFVLVGDGSDRPSVEQFAQQIGVRDHVHFLGRCSETASFLRRADIVWVPSLRGGGVCAALEAMAAGRPVVASHLPDLAEIVVNGETGFLVEPSNKAALARQTRLLLDDSPRRQRMGEAGQQHVREHFTVERLVGVCAQRYALG